ncbi:unnamed protein product [Prorocentrum cordatum]|uniref:Cryptochrome/DNA photolyase FAD-binding domain-containing protein n=1 Tax=Prorocentrum cordatum TaxID=2364126 RepID=A0ABN9YC12_9DINO|nr:unnamed protein product [Polarella glacialis]
MMWQHQGLAGVSQWLVKIDCHPVRHAKSADPNGEYVRRWVPELARLRREHIHQPWAAPAAALAAAGVALGGEGPGSYPHRIVEDVDAARAAFLRDARQCRAEAPASCFSADGCDYLSNPATSGLRAPGIWALTERCVCGRPEPRAPAERGGGPAGKGGRPGGERAPARGAAEAPVRRVFASPGAAAAFAAGAAKGKGKRKSAGMDDAALPEERRGAAERWGRRGAGATGEAAAAAQPEKRRQGRWRVREAVVNETIAGA